jgi:hypothetical protein
MTRRAFSTVAHTRPTADDDVQAQPPADVQTPGRQDVKASERTAFTWRQTVDQAERLDLLVLQLRRYLGRRIDKAAVLDALVSLAEERADIQTAVLDRLNGERPT